MTWTEKDRKRQREWQKRNRDKVRAYAKRYYEKNRDKERERMKRWHQANPEWQKEWNRAHPETIKRSKERFAKEHPERLKEYSRRHNNTPERKEYLRIHHRKRLAVPANRIRHILNTARWRSRKRGRPFDEELFSLLMSNVPKTCACCGIELDYSMKERDRKNTRSPSLDRINSDDGYTVQNTAIICTRCNFAKSDATLSELKLLVAYMEREQQSRDIDKP